MRGIVPIHDKPLLADGAWPDGVGAVGSGLGTVAALVSGSLRRHDAATTAGAGLAESSACGRSLVPAASPGAGGCAWLLQEMLGDVWLASVP